MPRHTQKIDQTWLCRLKFKGQLTIPEEIRTALGLNEGDYLGATLEDGRIVLTPRQVVLADR